MAATLFFASGIFATVAARRIMTILAQDFLFELRDRRRVAELAKANDRLELLASTDPLTGIANRRWMTETLNRSGELPDAALMVRRC